MGGLIVAPLPGWNVRGWSYGERTSDGWLHPGADLNVGGGDADLGLPVVAMADGRVVARAEWDGRTYGAGNAVLIQHQLGEVPLWSAYWHLDGIDVGEGQEVTAGEPVGTCGKTGWQSWAHLHFEVQYVGPEVLPVTYWGGGLPLERLSGLYADPFTLMRVRGDLTRPSASLSHGEREELASLRVDREYNFRLKMVFEGVLREMEGRRRVKRGTVERLIASVS